MTVPLWSAHLFAQLTAIGSVISFALVGVTISARVAVRVAPGAAAAMDGLSKRVRIHYTCSSFDS